MNWIGFSDEDKAVVLDELKKYAIPGNAFEAAINELHHESDDKLRKRIKERISNLPNIDHIINIDQLRDDNLNSFAKLYGLERNKK